MLRRADGALQASSVVCICTTGGWLRHDDGRWWISWLKYRWMNGMMDWMMMNALFSFTQKSKSQGQRIRGAGRVVWLLHVCLSCSCLFVWLCWQFGCVSWLIERNLDVLTETCLHLLLWDSWYTCSQKRTKERYYYYYYYVLLEKLISLLVYKAIRVVVMECRASRT